MAPAPMALLDDSRFYAMAAITWLLSACAVLRIAGGWVGGRGFRPTELPVAVLVSLSLLCQDALALYVAHGAVPESRRCSGPEAVGMPATGERVLMDEAYTRLLVRVAAGCGFTGLAVCVALGEAIWGRKMLPRPRVPARWALGYRWRPCGDSTLHFLSLFMLLQIARLGSRLYGCYGEMRGCCGGAACDRQGLETRGISMK